jgi:hypothetical protein
MGIINAPMKSDGEITSIRCHVILVYDMGDDCEPYLPLRNI